MRVPVPGKTASRIERCDSNVPIQAMNVYRRMEVQLHPFLNIATRWR